MPLFSESVPDEFSDPLRPLPILRFADVMGRTAANSIKGARASMIGEDSSHDPIRPGSDSNEKLARVTEGGLQILHSCAQIFGAIDC